MNRNITEYDAVIFDMDGVIIDSKEQVETFWKEKLEFYGKEVKTDDFELKFHGRPARLIVHDVFADLSEATRNEMIEECARYDASANSFKMIPGAEYFLEQCRDLGLRMALVTSALPEKVDRMLEGLRFPSPFHVIITADLVQNGKPDPECYLAAADRLGVAPERSIVFEDSVSGTKAASGAGATVIGINEQHVTDLLQEAGASLVIPDFGSAELKNGTPVVTLRPQRNQPQTFSILSTEPHSNGH